MDSIIVDNIDVQINETRIVRKLRLGKGDGEMMRRFQRLLNEAKEIARPKGLYKPVDFDAEGDDVVVIDGIRLTSRVLAVKLAQVHRVFAFVATCGSEAAAWAAEKTDMLERFWLETILDDLLLCAITRTGEHMVTNHGLGKTAVMTPGSIDDWPIQEQKPLFTILGDIEAAIGVKLMDSYMMAPRQSISGILFPTEVDFQTCMLCPRQNCPKRRAKYDPEMYDREFKKQ